MTFVKSNLAGLAVFVTLGIPAHSAPLITEQEASLPTPSGAVSMTTRGIMRGPKISLASPDGSSAALRSPMRVQIKFESFGGATVDPASVKMTYVKSPAVDLTPRIQASLKPDGIDLADAEIPPGDHNIRVELKDSEGRSGVASIMLKVAK